MPLRTALLSLLAATSLGAAAPARPPLADPALEKLAGAWKVTGSVRGKPVDQKLEAAWVLEHQFLLLHFQGGGYEAQVFIGWDEKNARYVTHWIDLFGGPYSEPVGHGTRVGPDGFILTFDYPDALFRDTFSFDGKGWRMLIESRDKAGAWTTFADERFTR